MNRQRSLAGLALAILLLSLVPAFAAAQTPRAPVEAHVWEVLEVQGQAEILVVLKAQADVEGARLLATKEEKGAYVYQQLTSIAAQTQPPLRAKLDKMGLSYRSYWIQNMFKVLVTSPAQVDTLASWPEVDHIEYYYQPMLDIVPVPAEAPPDHPDTIEWGINRVDADEVWLMGITGVGAVVGDLDTGVQYDHPALVQQYRGCVDPPACTTFDHNYSWWEGPTGNPVPYDTGSHGTHTMGTMVGSDLPSDPYNAPNAIGMAPGAKWIACPGIGSPLVGPFECFEFFLAPTKLDGSDPRPDLAPHVINNSWSSAGTNYHDAIRNLYLAGIYFAKSAGNTGPNCGTITNPGQWPEVSATAAFANGDTIASFSSRGPVVVNRETVVKPDVAAPGVNVRSSIPGNGYGSMQGTSMASPHQAGAVALLVSAFPELAGQIDTLQYILKYSAEPKISAQCAPYVDRPNDVWGWGILNIKDAVDYAGGFSGFGWLDGTVTDATTSAPLEGAALNLTLDSTGWNFIPHYSDASGYYSYTLLPAATYHITATHYGYLPGVYALTIQNQATTTQNIALQTAPLWTVSGYVTDEVTGEPLRATLTFEGTGVEVATDPATGFYSADIYQGDFWTIVRSPGHATEIVKLAIYGNLEQNFDLTPIYNYYMRTSEAPCGPTFGWIDATGGTPHPLGDDASYALALPQPFTFYGNTYTNLFIGSNGIVTFQTPADKWPGPIPDPATPNNGVYAFGTDLNPENGTQGNIYHLWVGNLLVVEWYQVQHYPSGNPETFEIILDFDTGLVTIQYLVVSDPTDVFPGVENAAGSEATAYPGLPQANLALAFYPAYSTSPAEQGVGTLSGTVIDADTSDPIDGALVEARDSQDSIFTATTDLSGTYSMDLCADFYEVSASADGYVPSVPADVIVFANYATTADFALTPLSSCEPPSNVDFFWTPLEPMAGEVVTFTASASGTAPMNYEWDFGDGMTETGEIVVHTYAADGLYPVALVVSNTCGVGNAGHDVLVATPKIVPPAPVPPVGLYPGGQAYNSFTIANTGTADLEWSLTEVPDAPWLEESTVSGVIAPGASVDIQITYTAPLTPGLYTTVLNIGSNDPLSPTVEVPIEMEVAPACERVEILAVTPTVSGCAVTFVAELSGEPPFTYLWGFGDGITSTEAMPTHLYAASGVYSATLFVENCGGDGYAEAYFTVEVECVPLQPRIYLPLVFKGYTP